MPQNKILSASMQIAVCSPQNRVRGMFHKIMLCEAMPVLLILPFHTLKMSLNFIAGFFSSFLSFVLLFTCLVSTSLKKLSPVSNLFFIQNTEESCASPSTPPLRNHKLREPFQSADCEHHSIETSLVLVISDLLSASDRDHLSKLSMLYLSAPFDNHAHNIPLQ